VIDFEGQIVDDTGEHEGVEARASHLIAKLARGEAGGCIHCGRRAGGRREPPAQEHHVRCDSVVVTMILRARVDLLDSRPAGPRRRFGAKPAGSMCRHAPASGNNATSANGKCRETRANARHAASAPRGGRRDRTIFRIKAR
jgi:hypothetical protein